MSSSVVENPDHGSHALHDVQLAHTGPAIVEEYYPEYATVENRITPLYATEVYAGATIILLSMAMLGLAITAIGYYNYGWGVSVGVAVGVFAANVAVFLAGLGLCMYGFRKHRNPDAHH